MSCSHVIPADQDFPPGADENVSHQPLGLLYCYDVSLVIFPTMWWGPLTSRKEAVNTKRETKGKEKLLTGVWVQPCPETHLLSELMEFELNFCHT